MKNYLLYFLFFLTFSFINIADSKTITTEPVDVRPYFRVYEKSTFVDEAGSIHLAYAGDSVYYAVLNAGAEEGWTIQNIDSTPGFVVRGIDIDSTGLVHILLYYQTEKTWYYLYGNDEVGWSKEQIEDLNSYVGSYINIKVNDTTGQAHIVYTTSDKELKHITNGTGDWEVENIEASGFTGLINNNYFAIDREGYIHIITGTSVGSKTYYLTNSSGSWVSETIDLGSAGTPSLIIDSSSKIHVTFSNNDTDRDLETLYYATNATGSWVVEEIDTSEIDFEYCPLAIDEFGNIHVAYIYAEVGISYYLRYGIRTETDGVSSWAGETLDTEVARKIAGFGLVDSEIEIIFTDFSTNVYRVYGSFGSWEIETVDSSQDVGHYSSMAVDPSSSDSVHIVYTDITNYDLLYTTNGTGVWNTEIIDSEGEAFSESVKIDTSGRVHVCYYDRKSQDLKYAVRVDKVWSTETIDSDGAVGQYSSLALDSDGIVHISYYDQSHNSLKYAYGNKGSWTIETIKTDSTVIKGSIGIDSTDKVHVAFSDYQSYDSSTKKYSYDVFHAVREDGVWIFETVERFSVSKTVLSIRLDIDKSDDVHIVYSVWDEFLKYTTNKSGSWVIDEIDSGDDVYAAYLDFKMDDYGYGHIIYSDEYDSSFQISYGYSGVWKIKGMKVEDASQQSLAIGSDGTIHFAYHQKYYGLYYGTIVYCDGTIDEEDECDDGGREDEDGCSALCEVESLYYSDEDGDGYGSSSSEERTFMKSLLPEGQKYFFTKPLLGYVEIAGDCNDENSNVNPDITDDPCDGLDNDCDGSIDEDFVSTVPTTCGIGVCVAEGSTSCVDGKVADSCTPASAGVEVCDNGADDDCDGSADETDDCPVTGSSTSSDSTTGASSTTGEGSGSGESSSTGEGSTTSSETTTSGEETTGGDSSSTGEGSGGTENGTTDGTTGGSTTSSTTGEEGSSSSSTSSDGADSSDGSDTSDGGASDEGNPNPTPPPADGSAAEGFGGCSLRI